MNSCIQSTTPSQIDSGIFSLLHSVVISDVDDDALVGGSGLSRFKGHTLRDISKVRDACDSSQEGRC